MEIDRRSFVKRAIGAGAAGSALLGVVACEDFPLSNPGNSGGSRDSCDIADGVADFGTFADQRDSGDRCDAD